MIDILIWGIGDACNKVEKIINYENVNIIAYIDNNKDKQGKLKENKPIIHPDSIDQFKYDYILIASQYYIEIYNQLVYMGVKVNKIINSFKFIEDIIKLEELRCYKKYLYNKFKGNYDEAKNSTKIDTIITGISYAECGIDLNLIRYKAVNLALSGQDLYYDYNIAKNVIGFTESNIRNVIIGLGYYSFQYDLSLSREKSRCIYVYKDILNLIHNYKKSMDVRADLLKYINKPMIESKKIFIDNQKLILRKLNVNYEVDFEKNWNKNFDDMCLADKIKQGKDLSILNSNKNYPNTVNENKKILCDYLEFLNDKGINVIIAVFPVTQYYRKYFDIRLKNEFYNIIEDLKKKYKFIFLDHFNSDRFIDKDFADCSHLNINGARKFTEILNSFLV